MCDKQLVSMLADDVTKEKDALRLNLLKMKAAAHFRETNKQIPLSSIKLTPQEKRSCMEKALKTVTDKLPEETRAAYKREIGRELSERKQNREEVRNALLGNSTKKVPRQGKKANSVEKILTSPYKAVQQLLPLAFKPLSKARFLSGYILDHDNPTP